MSKIICKKYATVFFIFLFASFSHAQVKIVEVMCNPVGSDTKKEWIKIKNTSTSTINLTGWNILDSGQKRTIKYTDQMLQASSFAYIARNKNESGLSGLVFEANFSLSNTKDEIALQNDKGEIIDKISYSYDSSVKEGTLCYPEQQNQRSDNISTAINNDAANDDEKVVVKDYKVVFKTIPINPKPELFINVDFIATTTTGAITSINLYAYNSKGELVDADFYTNLGDSTKSTKDTIKHIYQHSGKYIVVSKAQKGKIKATKTFNIQVLPAQLQVLSDKVRTIILNNSDNTANISGFILLSGRKKFSFAENSFIPAQSQIILNNTDLFGHYLDIGDGVILKNAKNALVDETKVIYKIKENQTNNKNSLEHSKQNKKEYATSTNILQENGLNQIASPNTAVRKLKTYTLKSVKNIQPNKNDNDGIQVKDEHLYAISTTTTVSSRDIQSNLKLIVAFAAGLLVIVIFSAFIYNRLNNFKFID